jgi:hypothetical protein
MAAAPALRPDKPASLWDIETSLHSLVNTWQEASGPEEILQAEQEIKEWIEREIKKVSGIRSYLKFCAQMAAAAQAEMRVQAERMKLWEAREDRLKAFVMAVMENSGTKKLEGETGSLSIRKNGGREPLAVTDEALIPEEYFDTTVTLPARVWNRIAFEVGDDLLAGARVLRTRNNERIREALTARCEACEGSGQTGTIGTHEDGMHAVELTPCTVCGGSGKAGIPGARLLERGCRLQVS